MIKSKSLNRGNGAITEEKLIQILESFQPAPSSSFYQRLEKAPWTNRYRFTRYALQVAVLMVAIFAVILINPSGMPPLASTDTPTSTATLGSTILSTDVPLATNIPTIEKTTSFTPSITP